ncbi:unnamed protein product [Calicophoron daubneyi]|uniref:TNFR-Cys domain-containing protein n=1 Tax=Calicophoron daubneyi TaxID=300641 RepID=A0AAV2TPX6_CALDB
MELIDCILLFSLLCDTVIAGPFRAQREITQNSSIEERKTLVGNTTTETMVDNEQHAETCPNAFDEFVSPVRGSPRCCRKCDYGYGRATQPQNSPLFRAQQPSVCSADDVRTPCEWNSDTQCQPCPSGFWSANIGETVKCVPCRSCTDSQILSKQCTATSDALCCPRSNENCTQSDASNEDYSSYLQEPDTSEKLIRQNQMLPIYCSIMGMIIISLLLYVVYKLWKQRESMTNAKLSEVYSVNLNGSVKGSLGARGNSLMGSRNGPVTVGGVKGVTSEPTTVNNPSCDGCPQWPNNVVETEPLISRSLSSNVAKDYVDQPLNTVPLTILGLLCSELSQKGLTKLAPTLGINLTDEYSPGIENLDLYQAALEASNSIKSVDEKQIRDSVFLLERLLGRPGVTIGVMCSALRHADRADLVKLLIPSGLQNSLSPTTKDECRTELSSIQSSWGSKNMRKPSGEDNQV